MCLERASQHLTFQGKMEFKDFLRTSPKIQGLFKTGPTLDTETINGSEVLARRVNLKKKVHVFMCCL